MDTDSTKTTSVIRKPEFWVTLSTGISGLLIAFGVLTPDQSDAVVKCVQTVVGAVVALMSAFRFSGDQHAAKVEVFRAMCAAKAEAGQVKALDVGGTPSEIARAARSVGL